MGSVEGVGSCEEFLAFIFLLVVSNSTTLTRRLVGITNLMISRGTSPLVNIAIHIRKSGGNNAMASVSNGFAVRIRGNGALIFSCLNCGGGRMLTGSSGLGVALRRSGGILSSIIIMNCNIRGGDSMANTVSRIGGRSVRGHAVAGTGSTLRNGATNIRVISSSTHPNTSPAIHVHNFSSGKSSSPLCMMSNIHLNSVDNVSPGSVTSVRILGSTTSTTVCNTRTNGNIILVAAGGNSINDKGVACSFRCTVRSLTGGPGLLGTRRCVRCVGRNGAFARSCLLGG